MMDSIVPIIVDSDQTKPDNVEDLTAGPLFKLKSLTGYDIFVPAVCKDSPRCLDVLRDERNKMRCEDIMLVAYPKTGSYIHLHSRSIYQCMLSLESKLGLFHHTIGVFSLHRLSNLPSMQKIPTESLSQHFLCSMRHDAIS